MRVIDRHIALQVIAYSLLVLLVLTALMSIVTFVGEFSSIGDGSYTLADAALYTVLYVPSQAYQVFVVSTLLGTMLGLGELASHNELMVMRTAGLSVARLGVSALAGGLVLLVLCAVIGEWVAPSAQRFADARRAVLTGYNPDSTAGGVWARDGDLYLNVKQIHGSNQARGILLYRVDPQHHLLAITEAASAEFVAGRWQLQDVRSTSFGSDGARGSESVSQEWRTFLSPKLLELFNLDTSTLSARGLRQYVSYLQRNHIDARRYVAAFWSRVARPIALLVMVLLALPFVFGPLRSATTGQRLVTGMLIGIGFFIFNSVFLQAGVVFGLNPLLAAWLPTALLAVASAIAVSRIR
ncbi:MAG: LPS export ABC transporter permease LptG [Gammaproteobacteria bacterium]